MAFFDGFKNMFGKKPAQDVPAPGAPLPEGPAAPPEEKPAALKPAVPPAPPVPDTPSFYTPGLSHVERAETIDVEGVQPGSGPLTGKLDAENGEDEFAEEDSDEPDEARQASPAQARITPMSELVTPAPDNVRSRASRPAQGRPVRAVERAGVLPRAAATDPVGRGSSRIGVWIGFILTALICLGLGAAGAVYWYQNGPQKNKAAQERAQTEKAIAALKADLETEKMAHMSVRTGQKRLFELLNGFHQDWNRLPAKPNYFKPGKGVVVFWIDGLVWRQYYVYQGKGVNGAMLRVNSNPDKRNFIYLKNLSRGLWRFSVSALTQEGKETARSEELIIKLP